MYAIVCEHYIVSSRSRIVDVGDDKNVMIQLARDLMRARVYVCLKIVEVV